MEERRWALQYRRAAGGPIRSRPSAGVGEWGRPYGHDSASSTNGGNGLMNSAPSLRVFVIDDEAPARRKILRFLNQAPDVTVVGEAKNGRDAVHGIQRAKPDLLFLDVQMPDR